MRQHSRTSLSIICGIVVSLYLVLVCSAQTALASPLKVPVKKVRPHVTFGSTQAAASPALYTFGNQLYALWVAKDNIGHLTIAQSSNGTSFTTPIALTDTTTYGYAAQMTSFQGHLYLAWFSSNGNNQVYLGYYNNSPTLSNHTVVPGSCVGGNTNGEGDPGPAITTFNNKLYVAWADCNDASIDIATSSDGYNFTITKTNVITHAFSAMGVINNHLYLVWAGTDYYHSINYGSYPGTGTQMSKIVVLNTTTDEPMGMTVYNNHMYIGWTGFPDQMIHSGYYTGSASLSDMHTLSNARALFGVGLAAAFGHLYTAWLDYDTYVLNISQIE